MLELLREIEQLNNNHIFESAKIMGSFVLSNCEKMAEQLPPFGAGSLMQALELFADTLFGLKEYKRALVYYRRAMLQPNLTMQVETERKKVLNGEIVAGIRYKIALNYVASEDLNSDREDRNLAREAMIMLEGIPIEQRNLSICMLLGKLYKERNLVTSAIQTYKNALTINPFAIEAMISLLDLNVPLSDVISYIEHLSDQSCGWIKSMLVAHDHANKKEDKEALVIYQSLNSDFPENVNLLLQKARLQSSLGQFRDSIYTYQKIHNIDGNCLDQMDEYADLLRLEENEDDLNRLTNELIAVDSHRPEAWVAISLYCDLKGEKEKALTFIEKALTLSKRHVHAYHVKGNLLLQLNKPDAAVRSHFKGYALKVDIQAFKGIIESNLKIPKVRDALTSAKEGMKLFPNNPQAISLLGKVYLQMHDGKDKARRLFEKALQIDPKCHEATLSLVDLEIENSLFDVAIIRLKSILVYNNKYYIHCKLAEVYAKKKCFTESLNHYNTALSLSPTYPQALSGLERLERMMRGEAEEGEGENTDEE